jgi:hypothetical protein
MPYFQRKPIEGLADQLLSIVSFPGLPSRGRSLPAGAASRLVNPYAVTTGIVEQAAAVLASERPSTGPAPVARSDTDSLSSTPRTQVTQLQEQVYALVEQLAALVSRPAVPASGAPLTPSYLAQQPASTAAECIVEPAPVLSPTRPVAPGGTTQINISLVNEDEQSAQIAFFCTELIGEDGRCIPAERVSFQPRELLLSPGKTGQVTVRIIIPEETHCGVYSGLVRASKLDYLHAVLVVQVEYS